RRAPPDVLFRGRRQVDILRHAARRERQVHVAPNASAQACYGHAEGRHRGRERKPGRGDALAELGDEPQELRTRGRHVVAVELARGVSRDPEYIGRGVGRLRDGWLGVDVSKLRLDALAQADRCACGAGWVIWVVERPEWCVLERDRREGGSRGQKRGEGRVIFGVRGPGPGPGIEPRDDLVVGKRLGGGQSKPQRRRDPRRRAPEPLAPTPSLSSSPSPDPVHYPG